MNEDNVFSDYITEDSTSSSGTEKEPQYDENKLDNEISKDILKHYNISKPVLVHVRAKIIRD